MHSISASQLNCYLGCSLQYKFRYVDKLPKPWRSAGMAFGTSIHAAIEWFHRERMAGRVPLASAAVAIFQADWYAQTVEPLIFGKNETKELLAEKGAEMIRVYIEAAATAPVPSAVEERFSVALVDVETGEEIGVDLHGIIDLVESDGTVVDFKTSARALLKTKTPRLERYETVRSEGDLAWTAQLVAGVVRSIDQELFFPNPSWRCSECEYYGHCNLWRGK
jgi:putative RecB family exonuclease